MEKLLFGIITTYCEREYYLWRNEDDELEIYTWDKNIIDKTFTQESGEESLYKKVVQRDEIGPIFEFDKVFEYKGVRVGVTISIQGKYVLSTMDASFAKKYDFIADQFDRDGITYHKFVEPDDKDLVMVKEKRWPTCI